MAVLGQDCKLIEKHSFLIHPFTTLFDIFQDGGGGGGADQALSEILLAWLRTGTQGFSHVYYLFVFHRSHMKDELLMLCDQRCLVTILGRLFFSPEILEVL